jgi:hypothetical protein
MSIDIPTAIAKEIRSKINACINNNGHGANEDDSKAHLCFELFELLLTWPGRKLMLNDFKAYEYIARKVDSILEDDDLDDYEDLQDLADDLYIVMNNIKLSFKE